MVSSPRSARRCMVIGVLALLSGWPPLAVAAALDATRQSFAPPAEAETETKTKTKTKARVRVGLLPVRFEGLEDADRRELLASELRTGLRSGGAVLVPTGALTGPCRGPQCWAELARRQGVDYVLLARITARGRVYGMSIALYDRQGIEVLDTSEACEVCGITDVAALLRDQGAALWVKLEDLSLGVPSLDIRSDPPGATVEIDGVEVGQTPLRLDVSAGRRRVRLSKPGFAAQARVVEAVGGTREFLSLRLHPQPSPSSRALPVVAWTSAGLSVGGFIAGSALLALDGREARSRCSGDDRDPFGNCRYRRESTAAAAVLLSTATVAMAVAITTAVINRRRLRGRARGSAALHRAKSMH